MVYFANKYQFKPSGIVSIRLKIPKFADYFLQDVLYIPQFQRNLGSLIHIQQQGNSIHIFDGNIEICRAYDHTFIMTGVE